MRLKPDEIKDHLPQLGQNEAFRLLKEWIINSNNYKLRRRALKILARIDDGSNYEFFESLFLSDENLNISLLSGEILGDNYSHSKSLLSVLAYTLNKINVLEKKLTSIDILKQIGTKETLSILLRYFKAVLQIQEYPTYSSKKIHHDNEISVNQIGDLLEIGTNILLYRFFVRHYDYNAHLQEGYIVSLECEDAGLSAINKISGIEKLNHLEQLNLKGNKISAIGNLSLLDSIKVLDLSHNSFAGIKPLTSLKELEILNLSHNKIKQLPAIYSLPNLKRLSLDHNHIKRIENVYSLRTLKFLNLSHNNLSIISEMNKLPGLKHLDVSNNQLQSMKAFQHLSSLQSLRLSHNQVRKIEGIASWTNLKELYLDDNLISQLHLIDSLENLTILSLNHNNITEISDSERAALKKVNFVFLNHNPLNSNSKAWYSKKIRGS